MATTAPTYVRPSDNGNCTGFATTKLRQCQTKKGACRVHRVENDFVAYFETSGLLLYKNGTVVLMKTVKANDALMAGCLLRDMRRVIKMLDCTGTKPSTAADVTTGARDKSAAPSAPAGPAVQDGDAEPLCGARTKAGTPCKNARAKCRWHPAP